MDLIALVMSLAIIMILAEILIPGFTAPSHLLLVLYTYFPLSMLAIAETIVVLSGEIDFSVGAIFWNVIVIGAFLMKGEQLLLPALICLLLGIIVGLINGIFTSILRIPSFITTLGMMVVLTGVMYIVGVSAAVGKTAPMLKSFAVGRTLEIPNLIWVLIIFLVVTFILLDNTIFGWRVRALGSNARAAYCSGIDPVITKILVFMISGFISAVTGLLWLGYQGIPYPKFEGGIGVGVSLSLEALAAVVLGGTPFIGGRGGVHRTFVGVLIISILHSIMISFGFGYEWQQILYGVIIFLVTVVRMRSYTR
jgi:ribose transport system permease protein